MAGYFSYLPQVYVRTSSYRTNNVDPYVLAKNIFRRIKIRENLDDVILGFTQYTIPNNTRPEQVAEEYYGVAEYDWVVLLCNNIINVYDEWPMTEHELYQYMVRKYGPTEVESVHHYITQEQRDPRSGRIILKGGLQVPTDFTYRRFDGTVVPTSLLIAPVSNYDYESEINDYKRNIYLLRNDYINQFVEEFENLVGYLPSAETDPDSEAKRSENVVQEQFQTVKPTYQTLVGQTSSIDFASTQEYTSRTVTLEGATIEEGDVLADGTTVAVTFGAAGTSATVVAGQTDEEVVNSFGSAGSSTGQTSGSSGSSGSGY
jgi:hypothetical protein